MYIQEITQQAMRIVFVAVIFKKLPNPIEQFKYGFMMFAEFIGRDVQTITAKWK